ncbi:4-hydroxythreonine-4-phosphate dehydrogenase PdxA [Candidatus Schneideria nysicola]|uniref:4-hydroxythreonine-4-phosphate dehydrogenase PdxA n=1 Tax=Candidatus Schneideria nysicola TaxID=1081631 RepID=UPI001CAA5862|nr:4-hydroxythreonine-4-phosphate dehydrogenase PdxA [Candidatus Schneideria nysicola]UAJ65559.1 4-hydroxythreonine-4-phosphate dehydrogenase PdxA [Candidatus Schneideria nysicola]
MYLPILNSSNKSNNKRIVITSGEPAGIGLDLIIKLIQKEWPVELIVCADPIALETRAKQLNLPIKLNFYKPNRPIILHPAKEIVVLPIKTKEQVISGKLNVKNSQYVIETLIRACHGCINNEFNALITGPVHKGIINKSGIKFPGHTEFLAKKANINHVVMMLANKDLRIALVTTHIPLSKITKYITYEYLYETIVILENELKIKFNFLNPKIYICGLNPHAGDCGYIGKEEINIIIPVINTLRSKGYHLFGPLSADTIFLKKYTKDADVILAMYHDQGLPIIKYKGFKQTINITLGLPFIRTSVAHGTALDLAGTGLAEVDSLEMALKFTINIINNNGPFDFL